MSKTQTFRVLGPSLLVAVGAAGLAFTAGSARADLSGAIFASEPFIVVRANNGVNSGQIVIDLNPVNMPGGTQTLDLGSEYYIYYNSIAPQPIGSVATLVQLNADCGVFEDAGNYYWYVGLDFVVAAGGLPTEFEILSPVVGMSMLTGITDAVTSATLGGTDTSGGGSGMSVTPMGAGGAYGFASLYNSNILPGNFGDVSSAIGGSTHYRSYFFSPITAGGGGGNTVAGNMSDDLSPFNPQGPGNPNLTGITSIQSVFHFSVDANDQANGTSLFMVPSPAASALLGLGGLLAARRRR